MKTRSHEINLRYWEEVTPVHVRSDDYDVEGFAAGGDQLGAEEVEALGDVRGKTLLHLQCHFGLDTLDWARRGASVLGVDFSRTAIAEARRLSGRLGLASQAEFLECDVLELGEKLNRRFDIVYTSVGALTWLSDLDRWGELVAQALAPDGLFYILEDHPCGLMYDVDGNGQPVLAYGYFDGAKFTVFEGEPDYADPSYIPRSSCCCHIWSLGATMHALESQGMAISEFTEFPYMRWRLLPDMRKDAKGNFYMPEGTPDMPLMYSFKARHAPAGEERPRS